MGRGSDGRYVALYDVSGLLPGDGYGTRPLEQIRRQYVHHSGVLRKGCPFRHMRGSARYSVRKRGWPGFAYHLWHPWWDEFDAEGERIVYQGQPFEARTWHAGAVPNSLGIAHCLQGNLSRRPMSEAQQMTLPVAIQWVAKTVGINATCLGHFQAEDGRPKASCPGESGKAWVLGFQAGRASRAGSSPWA